MKKEELRASLARIKPDEKLIQKTLENIEKQRERKAHRTSLFTVSYRLASAMCALIAVICVGIFIGKDAIISPVEDTPDTYSHSPFAANSLPTDIQNDTRALDGDNTDTTANESAELAAAELLCRAGEAEGDWQVVQGQIEGIYFVPTQEGEDNAATKCLIAIRVEKIHGTSDPSTDTGTAALTDEPVSASIELDDGASLQELADAIGSRICAIFSPTEQNGDVNWQITDYIICD